MDIGINLSDGGTVSRATAKVALETVPRVLCL